MSTYTLKMFNTGQVTLPSKWRKQFDTKLFVGKETPEGLLIQPLQESQEGVVFYQDKEGFGIYCEKGLPAEDIVKMIKEIDGSD